MNRKRIPYGIKLRPFLEPRLNDLREHTVAPDFAKHAMVEGNMLRLDLSLDDMEQGLIAGEEIHTRNAKLQKRLVNCFSKYQKFLDTCDDERCLKSLLVEMRRPRS